MSMTGMISLDVTLLCSVQPQHPSMVGLKMVLMSLSAMIHGVLNYMNVHDCFVLGRVHAGTSPSTVMNHFILHTTAFCHNIYKESSLALTCAEVM